MIARRVALYGGSFNPPHVGHLLVAAYVLATGGVDEIWLLPSHRHPFGKQLAPFDDRVAMCRLLASYFAKGVSVSTIEEELGGAGFTIDTVRALIARHPDHAFRLVVGSDILDEAPKWRDFAELERLAPLLVVARGGHPHPRAQGPVMPPVSSTEVRERLAEGRGADRLVPRAVLDYIRKDALYQE
ncbi:MAG TPA: nicotinate (nicotinamide) nucleotide adenylyltransferase [Vulgatibacter sp.]|nr:nicotinate (nicotinamide) nucleotide adenylyltransferase [Vulgatibacter sp.]